MRGTVVAVGEGRRADDGVRVPRFLRVDVRAIPHDLRSSDE
jgi:hypothetical protein